MSDFLVILLVLAIYIVGVFAALFLYIIMAKKKLKKGESLYKVDLPGFRPLFSWIVVILWLCVLFSKIGTLFNRIAIWYYGDKWYEAKKDN